MPVRSLNSSIMRWPKRKTVEAALRQWAAREMAGNSRIQRVGYFGSYSRNEASVGSDLDVVIVLDSSNHPFHQRAIAFDFSSIPVPVEAVIYTSEEWDQLEAHSPRFYQLLRDKAVWVSIRSQVEDALTD